MMAAVADGVGGEAGGELASAAATEALAAAWRAWQPGASPQIAEVEQALLAAARHADAAVARVAASQPQLAGAATTLTAAAVFGSTAAVVHGGDSRVYRLTGDGAVGQITRDHTWVEQELRAGAISDREAARHPMRHVITEYLGKEGGCGFDVLSVQLSPGDALLLCTDGLSNVVTDAGLAAVAAVAGDEVPPENGKVQLPPDSGHPPMTPAERAPLMVARLLDAVAQRRGGDDATVIALVPAALAVSDSFGLRHAAPAVHTARSRRPVLIGAAAVAALAAVAGAGSVAWRAAGSGRKPPPTEAAGAYLAAWRERRYPDLYRLLSDGARRRVDEAAFVRRHEAIAAEMTLTELDVRLGGEVIADGVQLALATEARLPVEVTHRTARFGELRRRVDLPLVWEGGRWKVDWSPTVILPELADARLVRSFSDTAVRGSILDRAGRPLAVAASGAGSTSSQRSYPQGALAGPLVGYVGQVSGDELPALAPKGYLAGDSLGRAGVEAGAEQLLAGQRGGRLTVVQPNGDVAETLATVPPRGGESVLLTLDLDLQRETEAILGERLGSIVLLDPRTGAIRALATWPRYNPNAFTGGGDPAASSGQSVAGVLNDPNQPLLLRPTQGQYPPGSTFKVITMAAALESGAFTPGSEFTCTGRWTGLPGITFNCWFAPGHGRINLVDGLTHSCNTVFYEIGKRLDEMDPNILPSVAARCGIGRATGAAGSAEAAGIAPSPAWKRQALNDGWARGDAVNMAIGQGQLLTTPLQLAAIYSAIATSGRGPGVRLVDRAMLPGGSVERLLPPTQQAVSWSQPTLDAIRAGLKNVVGAPVGTAAHIFQGSPLAAITAGKTGTAETAPGRPTHAWFACFAPFDSPRAVVLVMLEHAGEGSAAAAPVARRVLETVLDRM